MHFLLTQYIPSHKSGADPGGGGGPGVQGPLFQNEENSIYYLQFYLIPPNKSL